VGSDFLSCSRNLSGIPKNTKKAIFGKVKNHTEDCIFNFNNKTQNYAFIIHFKHSGFTAATHADALNQLTATGQGVPE
jgi:hypothetical protein